MIYELIIELFILFNTMYDFCSVIYALVFKNTLWFVLFHNIRGYAIPLTIDLNQKVFVRNVIKDGKFYYIERKNY